MSNKAEKIINSVGDAFDKNFTNKEEAMQAYNMGMESARNMQEAALEQEDKFSKRAVYYLAFFWSFIASAYIFAASFFNIPEANQRIVDTITGFLLGTIIAAIINFFFGSSFSSSVKTKQTENFFKRLISRG